MYLIISHYNFVYFCVFFKTLILMFYYDSTTQTSYLICLVAEKLVQCNV